MTLKSRFIFIQNNNEIIYSTLTPSPTRAKLSLASRVTEITTRDLNRFQYTTYLQSPYPERDCKKIPHPRTLRIKF